MISVIIPYFQKETGILQRALRSISTQQGCSENIEIIVVDDCSPIPASGEIDALGDLNLNIQCISQPNGGPGAARNTGLNHVGNLTKYVAFLDSDDEWAENHLANAVSALTSGSDFYFSDHLQLGADISAFKRAGRLRLQDHPALGAYPTVHAYKGDMFNQILTGNVIGTSSVVYDFSRFSDQRFKVDFTNFGEDYLFWMDIALAGAIFSFSENVEFSSGRGVNIYAGSGWGTDKHLLRLHNEIKFKKLLLNSYPINEKQRRKLKTDIDMLRISFTRDIIHRIKHKKELTAKLLVTHLRIDPLSFLYIPLNIIKIIKNRG